MSEETCDFCKYCDITPEHRGKEIPPVSGTYMYRHYGYIVWRYGAGMHMQLQINYCPMCGRRLDRLGNMKWNNPYDTETHFTHDGNGKRGVVANGSSHDKWV